MGDAGMFTILDVILDEHHFSYLYFHPYSRRAHPVGLIILSARLTHVSIPTYSRTSSTRSDGLEWTTLAGREVNSTLLLPGGGCFGVTSDGEMAGGDV